MTIERFRSPLIISKCGSNVLGLTEHESHMRVKNGNFRAVDFPRESVAITLDTKTS